MQSYSLFLYFLTGQNSYDEGRQKWCLEAVKLLLLDHTSQDHVDTTLELGQYFEDVFTHISKWINNHPRQNSCEVLEVMEKRKIKMIEKRKSKLSKGRRCRSTPCTMKTPSSTNGIETSLPFQLHK